jgi:hypothetical protein
MAWIGEMWQAAIERASALGKRGWWQSLPRPQWSLQRVVMIGGLLALSAALIWHCQGNAWVFCCGTVVIGQLVGAATGIPFGRAIPGALYGSAAGLLFFAFALIT